MEDGFPHDKNQYKIISQIGKGATATVYVAECLKNGQIVALKMIDLETCPIEIDNLRHEVAFWSTSQSPNIVEYYGSFVDGSVLYIVMEYMSAGSCYEIMRYSYKKGIQDELIIAAILHEVLQALVYFHDNRQIHRDIKAGNVLINEKGDVKIGDFGIAANLLENGQRKQARFTVIGTPCYMAPEVLKEEEGYSEKADIWSLGITAIELALGAAPYSNLYPLEVIVKIVNSPPPQLPDTDNYSPAFKDFVKQCLVHSPAKRASARQLLDHKFFKQIKDIHHYTEKFINGLPPLEKRFQQTHATQLEETKKPQMEPVVWDFSPAEVIQPTPVVAAAPPPEKPAPSTFEPIKPIVQPQRSVSTPITVQKQPQQQQQQNTESTNPFPRQNSGLMSDEALQQKVQRMTPASASSVSSSRTNSFPSTSSSSSQIPAKPVTERVEKFGKFTITTTNSTAQEKKEEPPSNPEQTEMIQNMNAEIKDLKSRVENLREQNIALKTQLDDLTELVRKLIQQNQ